MRAQKGFTLLELLLFSGIFALVMVGLVTIFVAITKVQTEQASNAEVDQQSQYLLQQFQNYIAGASYIDAPMGVGSSTIKLRMANKSSEPTIITIASGTVYVQQSSTSQVALTSNRVSVTNLTFTRMANPRGHDTVLVSFNIAPVGPAPFSGIFEGFRTSITRVSAANFDSDLVPSSTNLNLGVTGSLWNSINNIIYFSGSNVGIGNTAPSQQLTLTGNEFFPQAVGSTTGNLYFGGSTADGQNGLRLFDLDTQSGGYIDVKTNTSTNGLIFRVDTTVGSAERMRITAGGNVGIGTANPGALLNVVAADQTPWALSIRNNTFSSNETGGFKMFQNNAGTALIYNNNINAMAIASSGNVGIGNASPSYKLSVSGDTTTGKTIGFIGSDRNWTIVQGGTSAPSGAMGFRDEFRATTTMIIDGSGQVGIGVIPIAPLHVRHDTAGTHPANTVLSVFGDFYNAGGNGQDLYMNGEGSGGVLSGINLTNDWGWLSFGAGGAGASQRDDLVIRSGQVGIGTTAPGYTLDVSGTFAATIKNFDIPYPGDPSERLVHSTLEGPEAAVYYRGEAYLHKGVATVTLPVYFESLTRKDGRTVLLTPEFTTDTEPISNLAASYVTNGRFKVRATDSNNPNQKFYWEVKAVRSDVPPLQVIRPAN